MQRVKKMLLVVCVVMLICPTMATAAENWVDVSYQLNGGSAGNQSSTYDGDITVLDSDDGTVDNIYRFALPETPPYREGYLFTGWHWDYATHGALGLEYGSHDAIAVPSETVIWENVAGVNQTWTFVAMWSPIEIYLNGKVVPTDVSPFILEGRTMVPVRVISESLGCTVDYVEPFGDRPGKVLIARDGITISLDIDESWASVDHVDMPLDVPPIIVDGRTFVPLRFVSQALGASVEWQPAQIVQDATKVIITETKQHGTTT